MRLNKNTVVINNPAAKSGGALTILREFLEKIHTLKCNRKFILIVSLEELKKYETDKIQIFVINPQNFRKRIIWDNFGLRKFLKSKSVNPDLFISIQNTGVNISKNIPQIIYYHQPLSLVNLKWNFFKKEERLFWLYKNIYPFFIKYHLKKVKKIIVQTEWVKEEFSNKFNYLKENIVLMRPKIQKIDIDNVKIIEKKNFRIFYPATPLIYKNHKIIIEALGLLRKEKLDLLKKVECIFTFDKGESREIDNLVKKYGLEDTIKFIGKIPYKNVLEYYKSSDLLVFPSYLETFGLPLIEAQQFELDIIALDLSYVREVTKNYPKVYLCNEKEIYKEILKKINL